MVVIPVPSKTPLTDALVLRWAPIDNLPIDPDAERLGSQYSELLMFARKLERERAELIEAIRAAMVRIAGEFCSHPGPCSADEETCYNREHHALLKRLGGRA